MSPTAGLAAPIKYKHLNAWVLAQESVCAIKCEEVLDWARARERDSPLLNEIWDSRRSEHEVRCLPGCDVVCLKSTSSSE